jgi:hypothetical protein
MTDQMIDMHKTTSILVYATPAYWFRRLISSKGRNARIALKKRALASITSIIKSLWLERSQTWLLSACLNDAAC